MNYIIKKNTYPFKECVLDNLRKARAYNSLRKVSEKDMRKVSLHIDALQDVLWDKGFRSFQYLDSGAEMFALYSQGMVVKIKHKDIAYPIPDTKYLLAPQEKFSCGSLYVFIQPYLANEPDSKKVMDLFSNMEKEGKGWLFSSAHQKNVRVMDNGETMVIGLGAVSKPKGSYGAYRALAQTYWFYNALKAPLDSRWKKAKETLLGCLSAAGRERN